MEQNTEVVPDFLNGLFKKKEAYVVTCDSNLAPAPYADEYKMNHLNRGLALIFNHVNFLNPQIPRRDGSNKDRDDLVKVLDMLDFEVIVYEDLTAGEVEDSLRKASKHDFRQSDCFLVIIMSHGDNGIIYAKDKHYQTKMLWKKFSAKRCPTLAGKPKLFFIQACRGTGLHPAHVLHYGIDENDSLPMEAYYSIPAMADILVMYSTMEGDYSWRDPLRGSFFIQALVKQLQAHSGTKDLLTILTFVNREVAIDFTSWDDDNSKYSGKKQMCSIVSMLTRLVYFTKHKN